MMANTAPGRYGALVTNNVKKLLSKVFFDNKYFYLNLDFN
jgi:hypothetical protein